MHNSCSGSVLLLLLKPTAAMELISRNKQLCTAYIVLFASFLYGINYDVKCSSFTSMAHVPCCWLHAQHHLLKRCGHQHQSKQFDNNASHSWL